MFLYSWLHMSGYDIPMSEVKNFRQHHSATPGHPEFPNSEHNTPGIEATTGPLGQGVVNAAGIAAAQKMEQAMFNTKDHEIFNSVSVALCGDGCLQEGVSAEGAQFAVSRPSLRAVGCIIRVACVAAVVDSAGRQMRVRPCTSGCCASVGVPSACRAHFENKNVQR